MLFLIEYDRAAGIVSLGSFADADRSIAEAARLSLELRLNQAGVKREVVLLEAASEDALRQTHRRYFENVFELTQSSTRSTDRHGDAPS